MHQTFYIDIDEEITSIIETVKKSEAREIIIVVPKGALLIQSIINLKLLKREADLLEKELVIVTQDKIGRLLIEKAGITSEQSLEDIEGKDWEEDSELKIVPNESKENEKKVLSKIKEEPERRLDKIGSAEFFEDDDKDKENKPVNSELSLHEKNTITDEDQKIVYEKRGNEDILNKELVVDLEKDLKKEKAALKKNFKEGKSPADLIKNIDIVQKQGGDVEEYDYNEPSLHKIKKGLFQKKIIPFEEPTEAKPATTSRVSKNEKIKKFLYGEEKLPSQSEENYNIKKYATPSSSQDIKLPLKFWKKFLIISSLIVLLALGSAAYLFLPKANVTVFLVTKNQGLDLEIRADSKISSVDADKKEMPVKVTTFEDSLTKTFEATGSKSASNRKARGMITIYNEYSSASQPLVATTRFLSPDGKLFRLVDGVTIPGMTKVDSEIKPGAVEVEVQADEAGESFNIEPTTFTIPGFQNSGTEKYTKFYAKSFKAMTGGGGGDEMVKAITEQDISSAKSKISSEFSDSVKQEIKDQFGEEYITLDDALNISDENYEISNSTGDIIDEFSITYKAKVNAIIFSENNLRDIIYKNMKNILNSGLTISEGTLTWEFGKADADFENGAVLVRVHGNSKTEPEIDLNNLKRGILGKTNEELEDYLKSYPEFSNVEVEYWPFFLSNKIPAYEKRVEVLLDNN